MGRMNILAHEDKTNSDGACYIVGKDLMLGLKGLLPDIAEWHKVIVKLNLRVR